MMDVEFRTNVKKTNEFRGTYSLSADEQEEIESHFGDVNLLIMNVLTAALTGAKTLINGFEVAVTPLEPATASKKKGNPEPAKVVLSPRS